MGLKGLSKLKYPNVMEMENARTAFICSRGDFLATGSKKCGAKANESANRYKLVLVSNT